MGEVSRPTTRGALVPVLALAVFLPATTQSLLIPAVPELMRAHGSSPDDTAWVLTAFLIVASAAAPVGGRLGALYGRRPVMLAMLGAYVAGSLVCALADGLAPLVAGRTLQGCVGGTFPIAFSLARDHAAPGRARVAVALLSVVVGVGTGSGFALGGAIVDHAPLTAAFWGSAALGALALLLAALVLPREAALARLAGVAARPGAAARGRLDVLGGVLLVAGTALPLAAISQANRWGWLAPPTLALALAGALVLVAWARLERRRAPAGDRSSRADRGRVGRGDPEAVSSVGAAGERRVPEALIDVDVLRVRAVLLCNVATLLLGCGMFGLFVLTPQLAQQATGGGLGLGATAAGLVLLPGAATMLLVGPLATRIGRGFGDHVALAVGAATTALGLALLAGARGGTASVLAFAVLAAVGLGIAMPAMPALVAGAVPHARVPDAVGVNALLRGAGSAIGAQLSAAVLSATVVAGAAPTAGGYTAAYAIAGAAAAAAAAVALAAAPRRRA